MTCCGKPMDGACTDIVDRSVWCGTSIGEVLVFPDESVHECWVKSFHKHGLRNGDGTQQPQYIFEAEVMPYAVSLIVWRDSCAASAHLSSSPMKVREQLGSLDLLQPVPLGTCCMVELRWRQRCLSTLILQGFQPAPILETLLLVASLM